MKRAALAGGVVAAVGVTVVAGVGGLARAALQALLRLVEVLDVHADEILEDLGCNTTTVPELLDADEQALEHCRRFLGVVECAVAQVDLLSDKRVILLMLVDAVRRERMTVETLVHRLECPDAVGVTAQNLIGLGELTRANARLDDPECPSGAAVHLSASRFVLLQAGDDGLLGRNVAARMRRHASSCTFCDLHTAVRTDPEEQRP